MTKSRKSGTRVVLVSLVLLVALVAYTVVTVDSGVMTRMINDLRTNEAILKNALVALTRSGDEDMLGDLELVLEKNPEMRDFVAEFDGVADYPGYIDLSGELKGGGIPYLSQWDSRWGYYRYGAGLMGYTGCGPTCLSMVLLGLTGDSVYSPSYVAKYATDCGYCVYGSGTSWTLFSFGAEDLGLTAKELPLDEGVMKGELDSGKPIICIMGPGDFTDDGHFIVVTGYGDDGFNVLDPFREKNCKSWSYEKLSTQIRNLWSYSV